MIVHNKPTTLHTFPPLASSTTMTTSLKPNFARLRFAMTLMNDIERKEALKDAENKASKSKTWRKKTDLKKLGKKAHEEYLCRKIKTVEYRIVSCKHARSAYANPIPLDYEIPMDYALAYELDGPQKEAYELRHLEHESASS